jgi:arylformamidase
MIVNLNYKEEIFSIDLSKPNDLSLIIHNDSQINCFGAPYFHAQPLRFGDFVLSTANGASCNCFDIKINPHCNGTHTECVGHIAEIQYNIYDLISPIADFANVISIFPEKKTDGDYVITKTILAQFLPETPEKVLIIRTLPNNDDKKQKNYSGTNPAYIHFEAMQFLVEKGIEHLLIDLPSVDKENDEGKMLSHKAFWNYPSANVRKHCSITELVYLTNSIKDGLYFIQVNFPNIGLDASPSKVLLYELNKIKYSQR